MVTSNIMKTMETIWFIEIEYIKNNQIIKDCFKTSCHKYNTAKTRAWKWCDKNCNTVHGIFVTRLKDELNFELDEYKTLKLT